MMKQHTEDDDEPRREDDQSRTNSILNYDDEIYLDNKARKVKVRIGSIQEAAFANSNRDELTGQMKEGTFIPTLAPRLSRGAREFGSRFMTSLKTEEDKLKKNSILVAKYFADEGSIKIATRTTTFQRFSQGLALSASASMNRMKS